MIIKDIKLPWHVSRSAKSPFLIYNDDGYAVADCKVYHNKTEPKKIADEIVLRVNAYDEMLKALERIRLELELDKKCICPEYIKRAIKAAGGDYE